MQFYLVSVLLAASSLRTQDGVITRRLRAAPLPTAPEREQRGGPQYGEELLRTPAVGITVPGVSGQQSGLAQNLPHRFHGRLPPTSLMGQRRSGHLDPGCRPACSWQGEPSPAYVPHNLPAFSDTQHHRPTSSRATERPTPVAPAP